MEEIEFRINKTITFEYDIAKKYGIECAIVLSEINNICQISYLMNKNIKGILISQLYKLIDFITPNNIDKALATLMKKDYICIDNNVCRIVINKIDIPEDKKKIRNKNKSKKEESRESTIDSSCLFNQCWEIYRRKGSKKLSEVQWKKIPTEDYTKIPSAIKKYVESRDVVYQKDFERYLRDKNYQDVIYDKSGNVIYDPSKNTYAYYPTLSNEIIKNDKGFIYFGATTDNITDGYTNEERPNGSVLILSNGRGVITWDSLLKKWIINPYNIIQ